MYVVRRQRVNEDVNSLGHGSLLWGGGAVHDVSKERSALILLYCLTLQMKAPSPSKLEALLAQRQSVTSQKTGIFNMDLIHQTP